LQVVNARLALVISCLPGLHLHSAGMIARVAEVTSRKPLLLT
jgi:hypothetical protein